MAAGVTKRLWEIGDIVNMLLKLGSNLDAPEVKAQSSCNIMGTGHESEDFRS